MATKGDQARVWAMLRDIAKTGLKPKTIRKNAKRDLQLETLADVLDGKILVNMHCYRADEMVQILDIAKEFDYKVTTFHSYHVPSCR